MTETEKKELTGPAPADQTNLGAQGAQGAPAELPEVREAELTQFGVKAPPGKVRVPLGLISFVMEQAQRRRLIQGKKK